MSEHVSKTLSEVLPNQEGFELAVGYSLELSHRLMGYFPAIFTGTKRTVLVFDRELLEAVWKLLSPRHSEINQGLFYVNHSEGIAFPLSVQRLLEDLLSMTPVEVLTWSEFDQVTANGATPFSWAAGLVGNDMTAEEFQETLQAAMRKVPA